jgi:tetratricopeptide (TPR) repeat protein
LARAAKAHPEGLFHYWRGTLLLVGDRWAEAEKAFLAAAEAPSFARVRGPALFLATACAWKLAHEPGSTRRQELRAKALAHTRTLVTLGNVRPDEAVHLAHVATEMDEFDLARGILTNAERQAPKNLDLLRRRAEVELKGGAYGKALAAADRVLSAAPKDPKALRYRAEALAAIRKQAGAVSPGP